MLATAHLFLSMKCNAQLRLFHLVANGCSNKHAITSGFKGDSRFFELAVRSKCNYL